MTYTALSLGHLRSLSREMREQEVSLKASLECADTAIAVAWLSAEVGRVGAEAAEVEAALEARYQAVDDLVYASHKEDLS
jgi:hypothetical protein